MSRLRTGRRNVLRDAQRLPRQSARHSGPRRSRRRVLSGCSMIEALVHLPSHLRVRLASALETGNLPGPHSSASLRSPLGITDGVPNLVDALNDLERLGISGPAPAAWLRSVHRSASRAAKPGLVWSGPEVPGLHARDTRRVYEELLGSAERSIWASTYAFFDGPKAFEVLARRMAEKSTLSVTLLLNI